MHNQRRLMWDPEILCENNVNIETASLHSLRTLRGFTPGGQWKKADIEKKKLWSTKEYFD